MHHRPRPTTLPVHHIAHACFASMSRVFCTCVVDNNKNSQHKYGACKWQLVWTRFGFCFYIGVYSNRLRWWRRTPGTWRGEESRRAPKMASTSSKKSHSIRALPLRLLLSRTCLYFVFSCFSLLVIWVTDLLYPSSPSLVKIRSIIFFFLVKGSSLAWRYSLSPQIFINAEISRPCQFDPRCCSCWVAIPERSCQVE